MFHQRLTAVSLNVKQPSSKADFKQFIFSQSFKLFYSEAEDDGLFKPGQKPLKIIWCMEMCVTEIEKEKERMDHHHWCLWTKHKVKTLANHGCLKSHFQFSEFLAWEILGCRKQSRNLTFYHPLFSLRDANAVWTDCLYNKKLQAVQRWLCNYI